MTKKNLTLAEIIKKNYIKKEASILRDQSFDLDWEDIVEYGMVPLSKQSEEEMLRKHGLECAYCGWEFTDLKDVKKAFSENKCPECSEHFNKKN